jgi:hypothetical protein
MRNIALIVNSTLVISVVALSGCQKKKPVEEPQSQEPEKVVVEPAPQPESHAEAEKAALQAADAWLRLVDSGQYAKSWEETAEFFRNAVSQENWQKSTEVFRAPLGVLVSREIKATRYTTSAPGAPDGQYVIIQYNTSFANKKSAVETVTPMMGKDGKWRVSGYFIK